MSIRFWFVSLLCFVGACNKSSRVESPSNLRSQDGLIAVGTAAPAFSAQDQTGATRSLSDYAGKPVVLFFYPKDQTPGCTREACAFRDAWDRFRASNVVVLGVSTDDVSSHARFAAAHNLPFPLLADTAGSIARSYGVTLTLNMAKRVTFLIGGDGRITHVFPDVDPGVHADDVLSKLVSGGATR